MILDDDHEHIYSNGCDSYCNICGYLRIVEHKYTLWKTVKEPTKTDTGEKMLCCAECGSAIKTETIPMLPSIVNSVSVDDVSLNYKKSITCTVTDGFGNTVTDT